MGARRRADVWETAKAQVPELAESEVFVAGVVAYWAEGAKNKAWRTSVGVKFMNSDPALIRLFLAWLRPMDVADDRLVFRLQIHESAGVTGSVRFWAHVVGRSEADVRTTLKRHNPEPCARTRATTITGAWPSTSGAART